MSDDWESQRIDSEDRWDSTFDSDDPLLSALSDKDILGVCDGYDDWKLDTIFQAYVDLRRRYAVVLKAYAEATDRPWPTA